MRLRGVGESVKINQTWITTSSVGHFVTITTKTSWQRSMANVTLTNSTFRDSLNSTNPLRQMPNYTPLKLQHTEQSFHSTAPTLAHLTFTLVHRFQDQLNAISEWDQTHTALHGVVEAQHTYPAHTGVKWDHRYPIFKINELKFIPKWKSACNWKGLEKTCSEYELFLAMKPAQEMNSRNAEKLLHEKPKTPNRNCI